MSITSRDVLAALAMGVGATLVMDLWNLFLKKAFGIASLSYCLLGRWIAHMPSGTFRHPSIAAAPPRSRECQVGWAAHYSIGLALAAGFIAGVRHEWLAQPTLLPALLYGAVTVLFPYFVMQPALGFGIASSKARSPGQARAKSLATHAIFGIGLFASAIALRYATVSHR